LDPRTKPRLRWLALLGAALLARAARAEEGVSPEYAEVQDRLASGWNTWDVTSAAAQVLLPEGFELRVGLRHQSALNADAFLDSVQIGRQGKSDEEVFPGPHTWNGSYTEMRVNWHGDTFTLRTAHEGRDLVALVDPAPGGPQEHAFAVVTASILWGRPGGASRVGDHVEFSSGSLRVPVYCTARDGPIQAIPSQGPGFSCALLGPVGISTGTARTLEEIRAILERARPRVGSAAQAIETVMGWDTVYDPAGSRVLSPVSRLWSVGWGGYVLFDWDTFFAASLAAVGSRDLAYANALEILREETPEGFVPNYARPDGWKSFDRSEPPVGSLTLLGLYKKFGDDWLLRDAFPALLRWNRWWDGHRRMDGFLVLGSDAGNVPRNPDDPEIGTLQAAKYESGLDNSPMYDGAPFHGDTGRIALADVGLNSLYVADCRALAQIADILGRAPEAAEVRGRGEAYGARLETLWDEKQGMFLNRNLDTGAPSLRVSPTNFYPMLAGVATPHQARRMVREHLMNPEEFWGEWVIPSVPRTDPAFRDQDYWRGRVWGPMNYLVYLGLQGYGEPEARRQLALRSRSLFDGEWNSRGHVHENYNALTGAGDDVSSSDRFYHWGALLALIYELEFPGAGAPAR
jgi:hypothetical protein